MLHRNLHFNNYHEQDMVTLAALQCRNVDNLLIKGFAWRSHPIRGRRHSCRVRVVRADLLHFCMVVLQRTQQVDAGFLTGCRNTAVRRDLRFLSVGGHAINSCSPPYRVDYASLPVCLLCLLSGAFGRAMDRVAASPII
jgi:hypothetical protein